MEQFEVTAEVRSESGTSANRRLRHAGMVPIVLYGAGKEAQSLKLDANQVKKHMENEAFFSHILTVKVDGLDTEAVVKAVDRDPASQQVIHMDFLRVRSTEQLHMNVPLHFINEESSPGGKEGGVFNYLLVEVEIGCLPKDLPEYIEVDVGGLAIGDSLRLSDIEMPRDVTLMALAYDTENDSTVVSVQHPQAFEEPEEEEADELAEGEEPEEGEDEEAAEGEDDAD